MTKRLQRARLATALAAVLLASASACTGSVAVATGQVTQSRSVTLSGSYGGVTQSILLQVTP
jgi:hypothetical protein